MSITSRPLTPPLDFTVVREDWNRYDLSDSTILKVKFVLTKVFKQGSNYSCDFKPIIIILSHERGQPSSGRYTPQEMQSSIIQDDVRHTAIQQDWNEYITDDGTKIKVQPMIMRIAKTSLYDSRGEPIYYTDIQATLNIRSPNMSK
jgi:hypothetical protein